MRPYVVICVPSAKPWEPKMGKSVAELMCRSLLAVDTTILIEQNSGLADARNKLVLGALALKPDYLLFIDSDMVFPNDALLRLLAHQKDIVGATYNKRAPPFNTLGKWSPNVDFTRFGKVGIHPAEQMPGGFLLIHATVFNLVKPPWFFETIEWDKRSEQNPTGTTSEDVNFIAKAIAAGIAPFIDFDLTFEMGHIGEQVVGCTRPAQKAAA